MIGGQNATLTRYLLSSRYTATTNSATPKTFCKTTFGTLTATFAPRKAPKKKPMPRIAAIFKSA